MAVQELLAKSGGRDEALSGELANYAAPQACISYCRITVKMADGSGLGTRLGSSEPDHVRKIRPKMEGTKCAC